MFFPQGHRALKADLRPRIQNCPAPDPVVLMFKTLTTSKDFHLFGFALVFGGQMHTWVDELQIPEGTVLELWRDGD